MIKITLQKSLTMAGGQKILQVDMEIEEGDFVVIFGKSGTGKTSLLKMIAGIMPPDHGRIEVNNELWFDAQRNVLLPIQQRNLGFVFQDLALFPNMTVMEHLQFAAGKEKEQAYLEHLLALTDLETFIARKPQSLSGGQQQRLAIIRALARKPKLLLLDEPFSALDQQMGLHLRQQLKLLQAAFQFTTLLVSHEAVDIYGQTDKLIEIENGKAILHPSINNNDALNDHTYTGIISRIYPYGRGYILEIALDQETLKIPVDELTAKSLQTNTMINVTFNKGNLRLSSSDLSH